MASKYKRGRSWYLQYIENGKQKRPSLGPITETQAEAERLAVEERLRSERSAAGPLFLNWAEQYAEWHSQEYPDSYFRVEQILRVHLIPFFGDTPIGSLTRQQAEGYKHARFKEAKAGTVSKELRTLQACLNKAVEWEIIPRNPIKSVKPPKDLSDKPPRWYTKEELRAIYSVDDSYHRVWQLMANTGIRRSEALNLEWRNVGKDEIRVISETGARTKSGKWRIIPLMQGAKTALKKLDNTSRFVIPQVEPFTLTRAFGRALDDADLDGSLHCLRHTYCSHLVMAGVPLRTVQVLAGHASYKTTEKYVHLAPDYLKNAIPRIRL